MRSAVASLATGAVRPAVRVNAVQRRFITGREGDLAGGGGSFGKKEKALEEHFFRQLDAEKIKYLKEHPEVLKKEVKIHQEQQTRLDAAVKAAKEKGKM
ncbi:MAG: hypothetical protein BJ554DRAFT_990 [Olpidium bornovanus]|uniref:ATPase inhibitor, mitochondrial n=1 Tax=Olpidium bornovanus TaxID=278681 RepID=A0A8H7ZT54_9FUNG|nr:MAG: hypothetical protein BJ554DRAFT_990 [Olpidium bornovanus]